MVDGPKDADKATAALPAHLHQLACFSQAWLSEPDGCPIKLKPSAQCVTRPEATLTTTEPGIWASLKVPDAATAAATPTPPSWLSHCLCCCPPHLLLPPIRHAPPALSPRSQAQHMLTCSTIAAICASSVTMVIPCSVTSWRTPFSLAEPCNKLGNRSLAILPLMTPARPRHVQVLASVLV